MNPIYQITIKSIRTLENSRKDNSKGYNLLSFNLIYPREGEQSVETVIKIPLKKGETFDFKDIDFADKLIFKESIQGDSSLNVLLTAVEKEQKINNIFNGAVKAGIVTGLGLIPGGMAIKLITGVTKSVMGSILESAKSKDKVNIIGFSKFPINSNLQTGELPMHIKAPRDLYSNVVVKENGKEVIKRQKIKKDAGVAEIVFEVKIIESNSVNNK